jgi:hypothetical protein
MSCVASGKKVYLGTRFGQPEDIARVATFLPRMMRGGSREKSSSRTAATNKGALTSANQLAGSGFSRALIGAVTAKRKEESHD